MIAYEKKTGQLGMSLPRKLNNQATSSKADNVKKATFWSFIERLNSSIFSCHDFPKSENNLKKFLEQRQTKQKTRRTGILELQRKNILRRRLRFLATPNDVDQILMLLSP